MKTSFAATVALALFAIPAVASAAGLQYDPANKDDGQSRFVAVETAVNPANALAAKADADRYAAAANTAVIGTHGDTGAKVITEWDPQSDNSFSQFVQTVVVPSSSNAAAAKADAARYPAPMAYSSDSAEEKAQIRG
jgi:hypothetical protein